jgi:hypothetical protein
MMAGYGARYWSEVTRVWSSFSTSPTEGGYFRRTTMKSSRTFWAAVTSSTSARASALWALKVAGARATTPPQIKVKTRLLAAIERMKAVMPLDTRGALGG